MAASCAATIRKQAFTHSGAFRTRQSAAPANTTIESSGAYREEFLQQLFALAPDQVSQPIVIRDYVLVFQLDDSRDLTPERVAELTELVPTELQRFIVAEANQAFIVDDLYVDKFNQTFASDVLGQ